MADLFNRMFGRSSDEEKGSGATAKDRLKMVLTHDRIQVSPEKLKEMRAEIIAVIAKYVPEIDPNSVDISIEQTDRFNNRIVAQIPFSKARGTSTPVNDENTDLQASNILDDDEGEMETVPVDDEGEEPSIPPELITEPSTLSDEADDEETDKSEAVDDSSETETTSEVDDDDTSDD